MAEFSAIATRTGSSDPVQNRTSSGMRAAQVLGKKPGAWEKIAFTCYGVPVLFRSNKPGLTLELLRGTA